MEERLQALETTLNELRARINSLEARCGEIEDSLEHKASWQHCEGIQTNVGRLRSDVHDLERKLSDKTDHYDLRQLESKIENLRRGW